MLVSFGAMASATFDDKAHEEQIWRTREAGRRTRSTSGATGEADAEPIEYQTFLAIRAEERRIAGRPAPLFRSASGARCWRSNLTDPPPSVYFAL